jgi:glycine betaine/proline transport system permease protein
MSPEQFGTELSLWINDAVQWLVVNYGDVFEAIANSILFVLVKLERVLRALPWYVVAVAVAALAYHASRRRALAGGLSAALLLIWGLGLWDLAMQTLALMLVATVISVIIAVPIGILLSRHDRLRAWVLPVLDAMQTMPSFVYLIRRQRLFGVQLPLALPTIMAGVNQTTMMALSMVVIASMIGARGLGEQVLLGIQRLDVGRGTLAGIAIVALAIVLDRITQAYGRRSEADRARAAAG